MSVAATPTASASATASSPAALPLATEQPALPAAPMEAAAPAAVSAGATAGDDDAGRFTIAVRELVEFTAKTGDLDLRFTPAPTAQEGIEGHRLVALRRRSARHDANADADSGARFTEGRDRDDGDDHAPHDNDPHGAAGLERRAPTPAPPPYETEIALATTHGPLRLRGRADGYDPVANRLEEVKTYRGDLGRLPDNQRALHWAQARVYGAMLCAERGLATLEIAVVYFNVGDQRETAVAHSFTATELQAFLEAQCERFLGWARQELAHRQARDASLEALRFPWPDFRHGQRLLAEGVYRAARDGRCLLAQAPTGIGKTLGTLFPLLKACPTQQLDRVFFLTAKTPGRALALEAAATLRRPAARVATAAADGLRPGQQADTPSGPQGGARLRVLELTARDKACLHPDKECHGESCPLARGFYDRLPAARAAAVAFADEGEGLLDQPALQRLAQQHQVCPYYLAQELARWSDMVVGDYNYWFDVSALLHALTLQREWKVAVLADEAHNLVDRAREMYSAELRPAALAALRKLLPAALKRPLGRLQKTWDALHDPAPDYQVLDTLPADFLATLQGAAVKIADWQSAHPQETAPELLAFYFDALHFLNLFELMGPHSFLDLQTPGPGPGRALRLRNVIPAPHLAPRLAAAHTLTLFSATLTPPELHRKLLGLPADSAWLDVPSPFDPAQLDVHIVDRISTRYRDREASLAPIAELMAAQYRARPGNYLAFFSSHDYLQRALATLRERHPDLPVREQRREMDEAARRDFLAGFRSDSQGIAFAVLGGAFGEGIDLPGERLVGAFVATLGLPQVNPVNETVKTLLEAQFGAGQDYTYLYPGIRKVVQAAGRVIRTREDRGVVYLIDDRFRQAKVRALFPAWWQVGRRPVPRSAPS